MSEFLVEIFTSNTIADSLSENESSSNHQLKKCVFFLVSTHNGMGKFGFSAVRNILFLCVNKLLRLTVSLVYKLGNKASILENVMMEDDENFVLGAVMTSKFDKIKAAAPHNFRA